MTQSQTAQDSLIGRNLGRYRIVRFIGQGGFARVYLAVDESLGRRVALKVLLRSAAENPEFVKRFQREARVAAKLDHPNIVKVFDIGHENGYYYLAMAYVDGGSLQDLLARRKRLAAETVGNILGQVAGALDHAHSAKVVHRDVKPSNILLDKDGTAYLTDFGIAKAAWSTRVTKTGASIGTPEYMSPEQADGADVDYRTDLYSLGVIAYEMVSGRRPFEGENPLSVLYKIVHEPVPLPRKFNEGITPEAERVLLRALAKERGARFRSGAEMVEALDAALKGKRVTGPVPKPMPINRRPLLAGAGLLGVFVVVGAILLALNGGQTGTRTPGPTPDSAGNRAVVITTVSPSPTPTGVTLTPTPKGVTSTPTPTGVTLTPTRTGVTLTPTATGVTVTPTRETLTPTPTRVTPTPTPTGVTPMPTLTGVTLTPTPTRVTPTRTPTRITPSPTPTTPPPPPDAPWGLNPCNTTLQPGVPTTFSWSGNASSYLLEIWGDRSYTEGWMAATSFTYDGMFPGNYSWHVKGRNANGESGWSQACSFQVAPYPTPPPTECTYTFRGRVTINGPNSSNTVAWITLRGYNPATNSWESVGAQAANGGQYSITYTGMYNTFHVNCNADVCSPSFQHSTDVSLTCGQQPPDANFTITCP